MAQENKYSKIVLHATEHPKYGHKPGTYAFDSIAEAASWLVDNYYAVNSAAAKIGISAVLSGRNRHYVGFAISAETENRSIKALDIKSKHRVTKVKTFSGHGNNDDAINAWLAEKPDARILNITNVPMHDLNEVDGNVCNQWIDTIIVYSDYMEVKQTKPE